MTPEEKKAYHKAYYRVNKDKWTGKWQRENPEKARESKRKYKARNSEKVKAYNKAWAQRNKGRVTAYARAYQLAKTNAMPRCLSEAHRQEIERIYANRPEGYHVDHIIPLNGKDVCGLHVPWNLQYLPASENIKKSNKVPKP